MRPFPLPAVNAPESRYFCPAFGQVIDDGFCWECCMAGRGGPTDTAADLQAWIARTDCFESLADFQEVCGQCSHCAWFVNEKGKS
jgi:hypothetical protein